METLFIWSTLFIVLSIFVVICIFWLIHRRDKDMIYQDPVSNTQTRLIDGHSIHYLQQGQGPDLILIHGIGACIYPWRKLMHLLIPHYRVTAIDLPGFGKSSKLKDAHYGLDDQALRIFKLSEELGIEQATLVGSSMGGAISLWMAHRYPQHFPNVVALAPAIGKRWDAWPTQFLIPFSAPLQKLVNSLMVKWFLGQVVSQKSNIHHESIYTYLWPYLHDPHTVRSFFKAASGVLLDDRLWPALESIKGRVMILYGENDKLISKASMLKSQRLLSQVELHLHPEAGHHSMEDDPEWVYQKISAFVSKGPH